MTEDINTEHRRRRAAYRARHRGSKEMDWLLGRYADAVLPALSGEDLIRFERLLAMPDPDLSAWIFGAPLPGGNEFQELVSALRRFHGLEAPPAGAGQFP